MKLRLPSKLQAALIATLASAAFTTLSTGTLTVATGAALLAGQQAQAWTPNPLNQATTLNVEDGITYSGKIYTLSGTGNFSGRTRREYIQVDDTHMGDGTATVAWNYFASNQGGYTHGNTLRLTSISSNQTVTTDFSPFSLGGLIVEEGTGTYTLGRNTTCIDFDGVAGVNFHIKGNTTIYGDGQKDGVNGLLFHKGGLWKVESGKTLKFDAPSSGRYLTFDAGIGVDIQGGGKVEVNSVFAGGVGATINVGSGSTLQFDKAATLGGTITNAGTVTFNGAVTLTSDLSGFEHTGTYVDYTGASGNDGFAGNMYYYIVKKAADTATSTLTSVTLADGTLQTLDANGGFTSSTGGTDYTAYYINTSNATMDLAQAFAYVAEHGAGATLSTVNVQGDNATITVGSPLSLATLSIAANKGATVNGTGTLTLDTLTLGAGSTLSTAGTVTMNVASYDTSKTLNLGEGTTFNYTRESDQTLTSGQSLNTTGAGTFTYGHILQLQDGSMSLGSNSEMAEVDTRGTGTINLTGGTHEWTKLGLGQNQASNYTLNVQSGAALHITGTAVADSNDHRYNGSFQLSHWGGTNNLNVYGKLISNAVMSSWDGTANINVKSGGELELRQGLTRNYSASGTTRDDASHKFSLTVENGGTLTVGATPDGDNFSHAGLVVTMQSGATLGGYFDATHTAATVYQNITGPESGTLTFRVDGPGNTLTMQGTLSGDAALVKTGSGAFMLANGYDLNHVIDLRGGSIGFSGTYDLSSIAHEPADKRYSGGKEDGVNGFVSMQTGLQLVTVGEGASIGDISNARFVIDDVTAELDATGYARTLSTPDYNVFHVLTGTENVTQGLAGGAHDPIYSLGNGAKLVVDANVALGKFQRESGSDSETAYVQIETGKTLSVDSTVGHLAISGSGVYELNGTADLGGALDDTWSGTVRIVDAEKSDLDFKSLVKGSSTLELQGFNGYNHAWYESVEQGLNPENIKLTNGSNNYAWRFTGNTSRPNHYVTFSGNWSGTGTLKTAAGQLKFIFSGNVADWTGTLQVESGTPTVAFQGSAAEIHASIDRNNQTLNLEAGDGTNAFTTAFHNTVNASSLTVKAQANATFKDTVTLNGALSLNGNSTATFEKAVSAGSLAVGDNKSTGAAATFDAGLTLNGNLTLNGTEAVSASVALNGDTTVGNLDLSNGHEAHGTVTLAGDKTLTVGGNMWMHSAASLVLKENATFKKGTELTVVGLSGDGSVSNTSNSADTYNLNNSAYTLTNVQATINEDKDDVQLRFDNSKFVTSHNVTLKNLQSIFSGMDIQDGTTTVGAAGSPATTVALGAVQLSGGDLTLEDHVTGSVDSLNVTASGTISGGKLSMGGAITTQTGATLTLGGTVLFGSEAITSSGTGELAFGDSVVFDIRQLTEGEDHTYTLFTGNTVDLTSLNATAADHIAGVTTTGRIWTFGTDGTLSYTIDSRNLMWFSYDPATWTSEDDTVTPWTVYQVPGSTYFHNGDSVTFSTVTGDERATLGSDVTVATMTLDGSAEDVTVINDGTHSFSVEVLDIQHGHLTTDMQVHVKNVSIVSGAEWSLGGTLNLDTLASYSNGGLLHLLNGAELRVQKGSTTETVGAVTADAGGTLYVENGGGKDDDMYTFHGVESAPFMGTLVYDVVSGNSHDNTIALENFQGTLELRGRLAASTCDFGGMTKLVLNGDRSSNNTGMWNSGAFSLDVPVDIVGNERVDLYVSAAMTITGDVNSGTERRGHLGKQNNGALTFGGDVALASFTTSATGSVNFNGNASLASMTVGNGTVNMGGTTTIDTMNVSGGTVNLNGGATLGAIDITGGTVNLSGADKTYSLGETKLNGGNLAVGATGVGSLAATDLIVIHPATLSSAAANPTVFNVTNFDVSNHNTNFTLQNVTLNVSSEATAAVLNTAQNVDQATVTVDSAATLNLNGSVVWKKVDEKDATKTDYVNLTINNAGAANVNGGEHNILNNVTLNHGGSLTFGSPATTEIAGTLALADTITNAGTVTIHDGSVAAGQTGTLTGSGTYNLTGTITNAGTLQLADATFNGAGAEDAPATITGNVVIHGGTYSGSLVIGSAGATVSVTKAFTLAAGASLDFSYTGALVLDNLEGVVGTYSDGVDDPTNNGFRASLTGVVFNYLDEGEPLVYMPLHVTYRGENVTIWPFDGKGEFGLGASKTTFYVNTDGTAETYSLAKAAGGAEFSTVELANGTGFNMDEANAHLNLVKVREGAAASLTIGGSNTTITAVQTGAELTLAGEGSLTLGSAAADQSLNGAGTLVIDGPTVTINGTNNTSFTGNVDIKSGILKLGSSTDKKFVLGDYNYAADATRTITVRSGATLDINGQADANYVLTLDGGRFTNNAGGGIASTSSQVVGLKLTANSYVGETGHSQQFWLRERSGKPAPTLELNEFNLTKQGTSTFGLHSTTVTGTGYLVVEEGTVQFNDGGTFGANFRLMGGTAASGQAGAVIGTVNLTENTTIDATAESTSTFAAVITGDGKSVTKTGAGTVTLSGANTYTGGTTVSAGTLVAGNASALGTGALTLTGGELVVNAVHSMASTKLIDNNGGKITMNAGSGFTVTPGGSGKEYNIGTLAVNGAVTFDTASGSHNPAFNIGVLTGDANSILQLQTTSQTNAATVYNMAGGEGSAFSGTVKLYQGQTNANSSRLLAMNIKQGAGTLLGNSAIILANANNAKSKVGLGVNTDATVRGISSDPGSTTGEHTIFSGAANMTTNSFASGSDRHTLTIATQKNDDFSTRAQVLGNLDLKKTGEGSQTFTGDMSHFNGSIDVEGGVLNIMNIAQAVSVTPADVTIKNSTLGVYTGDTAEEESVGTLTITAGHKLTGAGEAAQLNANLVMNAGSTLDVSDYGGVGGLHMGCSVTLNPGMSLSTQDMEGVAGLGFMEAYDLHYDVESFFIGDTQYTAITFASETWVNAAEVFTNPEFSTSGKDYYVFYSGSNAGGHGGNVGTVYIVQVPEPTTGTLSLLALAALAARRRKHN